MIHHHRRGDKLTHNRKYYKTLLKKKVNFELNNTLHKDVFLTLAQRCERKDVYFEKDLQKYHFNQTFVKEELQKKGIFLPSMQKRKKMIVVNLFLSKNGSHFLNSSAKIFFYG